MYFLKGISGTLIIIFVILVSTGLVYRYVFVHTDQPTRAKDRQKLDLALPQNIDTIGVNWGNYWSDEQHGYTIVTDESDVNITLPSGRRVFYQAVNLDLGREFKYLYQVYLRLEPRTNDYEQALTQIEFELEKLSLNQNEDCLAGLSKLRKKTPERYDRQQLVCTAEIEKNVQVRIGLGTMMNYPEMGWVTFLEFSLKSNQ